jgi:hypothetical protein
MRDAVEDMKQLAGYVFTVFPVLFELNCDVRVISLSVLHLLQCDVHFVEEEVLEP